MKKFVAILLTLFLLLGTSTAVLAKNPHYTASTTTTTLPAKSTYEFKYQLPVYVVEDRDATLGVTLKTSKLGQNGYDDAYLKFAATGPGSVSFAKDSSNTYVNGGTLDAFDLPAQYGVTTNWTLNFTKDGTYTITFRAFDASDNEIAKKSQEIIVTDGAFVYTVPDNVYTDTEVTVSVGFVTEQDFDDVHFAFRKASGTGDIIFKAKDSADVWHTFTNSGTWGPAGGFDITGPYNVTTPWKLKFSEPGSYNITFKLVDEDNDVLVQGSQKVIVKDSIIDDDDDEDEDEDEDNDGKGNVHGLLNALRAHLKIKNNGNPHARVQSINRLMELVLGRGMSQADLDKAIEELEEALSSDDDDSDEDYKALGKMHQLKGKKLQTFVNGKKVEYDETPIIENGRTLVPFRKIAEALEATVSWDSEKKQVTVTKGDKTVVLTIGSTTAQINGVGEELTVPPKIYKNRTLIPLRFIATAFGAGVDFYPDGELIVIKKKDL